MWNLLLPAGMSLLGGLLGNSSAKKAANAQVAGMQQGADTINGMYSEAKGNLSPYMDMGRRGNSGLMGLMNDPNSIADSSAYKWRMSQGMGALDNSAAARGMLFSGAHSKDAMNYGQGLASQEYDNEWNRMMGLSTMGQNSAMGLGQLGANAGNSLANLYSGMGNARGSSFAAQGQNNANMLGGLAGMFSGMKLGG